ncbi:metal ABC transporter solute-binding protein, Zn/Mn family [Pollutimonas bauzanensis]|uniref:Zinc/manganese transport system substrate-binding protein n=1 Tax=Pollutimonas bauzanensis TaxID=658167 RepID=A0A1M5Z3K6_9BURK|nr:zinc ABC transporter substrate-binding protein [Pollutimonas bauzanensis]SHI18698.1 zinc/manganese transport system substrate-binding protein [Pollutimonas bauzanensis]
MNSLTRLGAAIVLASAPLFGFAASQPVNIVAAENFYGDIAEQLGGPHVRVTSILSKPDQDPHLFEASVSTAKALSGARLVIYNGIDYDPWMDKLLAAAKAPGRKTIVAAQLLGRKAGDNPHLWYDPATMPAVAKAIAAELEIADPANKADYRRRLQDVLASLQPLNEKIQAIRAQYAGAPVTATEPVFGYMAEALGLAMRNGEFQLAVMNDTEPSARQIAAFENDLKTAQVKILFYNKQVSDQAAERARRIALDHKVSVVGVTETKPAGKSYQEWMLDQLAATQRALSGSAGK